MREDLNYKGVRSDRIDGRGAEVLRPCAVKDYVTEVVSGQPVFEMHVEVFHECNVPGRPAGTLEFDPSVRLGFLDRTL